MSNQPEINQIWKNKKCDERIIIERILGNRLLVKPIAETKRIGTQYLQANYDFQEQIEVVEDDNNNNETTDKKRKRNPNYRDRIYWIHNSHNQPNYRVLMVSKITMILLKQRINQFNITNFEEAIENTIDELPTRASQIEFFLHKATSSKQDYSDPSKLENRIRQIINTIRQEEVSRRTQKLYENRLESNLKM